MLKKIKLAAVGAMGLLGLAATIPLDDEQAFVSENFAFAGRQLSGLLMEANKADSLFPRTFTAAEKPVATNIYEWTSGFFAGNLWYAFEGTGDKKFKDEAIRWTEKLEPLKTFKDHHDLGFMMYCSYGNAYRLTGNKQYRDILIQSAKSLSTRFSEKTGSIKSWNGFGSWDGKKSYKYPVIIDNMMNLELLFFASKESGDQSFKKIAMQHADNVLKNQLRPDYSIYHVVCYDPETGKVLAKETAQGYANNSVWARGQAWGIYGFTMCYRETKEQRYLNAARKMADFYIKSADLPSDKVPYWDFYANKPGYMPAVKSKALVTPVKYRDASAAAITASALIELGGLLKENGKTYVKAGSQILHSLGGPAYRATYGQNGGFILKHSVGSIPHNMEIDVPLVYADYYYLEALERYNRILKQRL